MVFAKYIRAMDPGREPPDGVLFGQVQERLGALLRLELQRRDLWRSSPAYLGVLGGQFWQDSEVFSELLADCHEYIFIRRRRSLRAQLAVKPEILGLVRLNVRHFVFERQKKNDPLGYRIYEAVHAAVCGQLEAGTLSARNRGERDAAKGRNTVRGPTVLVFAEAPDAEIASEPEVESRLELWWETLLPGLVTARGRDLDPYIAQLGDRIASLYPSLQAFRFSSLVRPFKREVRRRWRAIWEQSAGETAVEDADDPRSSRVHFLPADTSFEARRDFGRLVSAIHQALEEGAWPSRTHEYLVRLWAYLRAHAEEETLDSKEGRADMPSRRQLAELLDIPRYRLPELFETLGDLVQTCRDEVESRHRRDDHDTMKRGYPS